MTAGSNRTRSRIALLVGSSLLIALPVMAATLTLKDGGLGPAKLEQSKKLHADFKAKKLSPADTAAYRQWLRVARQKQKQVLSQPTQQPAGRLSSQAQQPAGSATGVGNLTAGGSSESCECTATCQTVLVVNGGSIYFEGNGTVSSPSACADAAEAFCSDAVSTFLSGWSCK